MADIEIPSDPAERLKALKALLGIQTNREVAERLARHMGGRRVSKVAIAYILNGQNLPGRELSLAIEEEFGIPASSWMSKRPAHGSLAQEVA